jgi:hypothetical protein
MCYRELGDGNGDGIVALLALKEVGVAGVVLNDHVPRLIDDMEGGTAGKPTPWVTSWPSSRR